MTKNVYRKKPNWKIKTENTKGGKKTKPENVTE